MRNEQRNVSDPLCTDDRIMGGGGNDRMAVDFLAIQAQCHGRDYPDGRRIPIPWLINQHCWFDGAGLRNCVMDAANAERFFGLERRAA